MNWAWNNRLVSKRKRGTSRLNIVTLVIVIICRVYLEKCGLAEGQAGIKIARRSISNLRYTDDIILRAESEEELKSLLLKMKEESEKVGLELNIQKMKITASVPISS